MEIPGVPGRSAIDYKPDSGFSGGIGNNGGKDNEPNPNDEAESQKYTRVESLSNELIGAAETPEELFIGLRQLLKQLEDSNIPQGLSERYTPPRQLSAMYERADMLKYTVDDLIKLGWVTKYNSETGEIKLKDKRFAAVALKTEQFERTDEKGRYIGVDVKYYAGKGKERENLHKAYERAIVELEARDIMGEHINVRTNIEFRDSLETLVAIMHGGRMPKFKPDHLEALFNMPAVSELETNPENKILGDQVEEAMFLNLVMLSSGNKQRMEDLLERPGAKHLIAKMAKEKGMTYDKWIEDNIGRVNEWVNDNNRVLTGDTASWRTEPRGALTKWSNIAAWAGDPGEFGADKEFEFIEKTIGGLVGSSEASWIAATNMRVIGAYGSEGYVAIPNGESHLPLGEGRYISGDDTGKFHTYMFNMKEGRKGRTSGLKDMIGRIPDLSMNLYDWAAVVVGKDANGKEIRRSIWDAWLGTAGNKPIKDLLTGKPTGKMTVEEPYHRLGDLNFKSLEREFHGTFTIMQWLMGNGERPTGVMIDALQTDFRPEEFTLNELKKKWKYIDIVMNPVVLTKGSQHLYDLGKITSTNIETFDLEDGNNGKKVSLNLRTIETKNTETVKKRFFRNLMAARIKSYSFATRILPETTLVFSTNAIGEPFIKVPTAHIIEMFINEMMKNNPKDEGELINKYIDDFDRLNNVSKKMSEVASVRIRADKWLTNEVGRVVGK